MRSARVGGWMCVALAVGLAATWVATGGCNKPPKPIQEPIQKKVPPDIAQFNNKGELILPDDYRSWVFIGAPLTPNDLNDGKAVFPEFHDVYIDRDSYNFYARTGKFRDGTVLVKELVTVGAKKATSGNGYFPGGFNGIAVSVKSTEQFPREPGHWAYFSFGGEGGTPMKPAAAAAATASCNACHQTGPAEDWVFTQFYPVLKAARAAARNEAAALTPVAPLAAAPGAAPAAKP